MTCAHEDLIAFCPHGCPEGTYDSDTNVCSSCKEPVCPTWNCAYCDEQIGEGFERPTAKVEIPRERTIPPHACLWVQDGESDPNSGDYKERCTICPATRWQTLADAEAERLAAEDSLVGETSAEWIRRMAHS